MSTRAQLHRQRVADLSAERQPRLDKPERYRKEIARKPGKEEWQGCPSGKFGHYTRAQARKHAYSLREKFPEDTWQLDIYPCSSCGRFHVGHARIQVEG